MAVQITAQSTQVWITNRAGNELEITSLLISLVTENDRCGTGDDLKGFIKTTGTLVLNGDLAIGFTESLDPRNNDRWRQGNLVRVQITRRNGTVVSHPRGALRILQTPNPTRKRGRLTIKVGCELAYLDTMGEPENNTSFTIPANGLTRREAINLLAARAGLPSLGTEIVSPNIRRIRSRLEGNRVEEIGNLALAASNFVWLNNTRTLSATAFNLDAVPTFTGLNADTDFSRFDIQLADEPVPDDISVATKRTNISIKVSEANGFSGDVFANPSVLTTGEDATRGELFPELFRGDSSMTAASRSTITKNYSSAGWLTSEEEVNRSPKGLIFPTDFPGDLNLEINNRKTTTYTLGIESRVYGSSPVVNYYVSEIKVVTEEPEGLVNATATDKLALTVTKVERRIFSKIGMDWAEIFRSWDKRTGESSCKIPIEKMVSPPSPTPRPVSAESRDVDDLAETGFDALPPRKRRVFRFNMNVQGSDQTQNLANLIGRLQYGATQLAEWECEIPDVFLAGSYAPQQVWEIVDQGFTYRYLSDGHVFACTPNSAVFSCVGYYLGRVQAGVVIPPFRAASRMLLDTAITTTANANTLTLPSIQLTTTITGAIAAQEITAGVFGGMTLVTAITGFVDAIAPVTGGMTLTTTIEGSIFSPPDSPYLQEATILWFRPDAGRVTVNASNRVSQIRRSPSNQIFFAANQSVAASQPLWLASAINGRPAIQFDGVDDYLFSGSSTIPVTAMYFVFRIDAALSINAGILSFFSGATKATSSNEDIEIGGPNTSASALRTTALNAFDDSIYTAFFYDGVLTARPTNSAPLTVTPGWHWALMVTNASGSGTKAYTLGASAFGPVGSRHSAVTIAEYHIYTALLPSFGIDQIREYINFYYGI